MNIIEERLYPNGQLEYSRTSSGWQTWYNENNKKIREQFQDQPPSIWEYDEQDRLVHWKHAFGPDVWRTYVKDGAVLVVHEWDSDGFDGIMKYENGQLVDYERLDHNDGDEFELER